MLDSLELALLALTLGLAVWRDISARRLPNWLTVGALLAGLLLAALDRRLPASLYGAAAGFAAGFLLWQLGMFRAGDAKLMTALGGLMGLRWLAGCFAWTLMAGALLGTALLLFKGELASRAARVWRYVKGLALSRSPERYQPAPGSEGEFPFAVSVAAGSVLACVFPIL